MAFLTDDSSFTHVIAIDFGTGASGYELIINFNFSYGIAPKLSQGTQKPRIEVFNPVEDNDDQKTTTTILFDQNFQFLAFGTKALQRYAELVDDGEIGLLFQTVNSIF
jgi:hypothetical protein